jgi:hypothetical protein
MLAYILAVLVGTSSVGLYLSAFFFPEIHRKQDFIWSGVGLFYALFLWLYAHQVTGGILVGQTTSVALLGWLTWQTLKLRRQLVPVNQQPPIPNTNELQKQSGLNRSTPKADQPRAKPSTPAKSTPTTAPPAPITPPVKASAVAQTLPLAEMSIPPASPKASLVESNVPPSAQQIPQSAPTPPAQAVGVTDTEKTPAWIKPAAKPSPDSKPLGTAVRPPTSPTVSHPETPSPAIIPEVSTTRPIEAIQTTAKLDSQELE